MVEPHQPPAEALDAKAGINEIMESSRHMKRKRDTAENGDLTQSRLEEAFDQRDQLQGLLIATQAKLLGVTCP
jgi:hypothetical protein